MEVHAHPIAIGSHTPRKKWTHYFWEFLMLFLAVFCGFLAEYQLEHTIEHQRAKEFSALMYEDLKKDTADYRTGIEQFTMIEKHHDSLSLLLNAGIENVNHYSVIKHWINGVWALSFIPHQATYEQMKNSGSLRYIKKIGIVNSMQDYYNRQLPKISHYHEIQSELTENRIVPFMEDHIDYREADFLTSTIHTENPEFFDWNKKTAVKLYNMMAMLKSQNGYLKNLYSEANGNAISVMRLLKKEYHLQ